MISCDFDVQCILNIYFLLFAGMTEVFSKYYEIGDYWNRGEADVKSNKIFQVL